MAWMAEPFLKNVYSPWTTRGPGSYWNATRGRGKYTKKRTRAPRAGLRMIKTMQPKQELKFNDAVFRDTVNFGSDISGGVLRSSVNLIANGTGAKQRIGRKIVIRSIHVRGVYTAGGSGFSNNTIRLILGVDKQTNGVITQREEFLDNDVDGEGINMFKRLSNVNRFDTLFDRRHDVNALAGTNAGGIPRNMKFEMHKKCYVPIEFDGTSGLVGEIASNNIFLDFITDQSVFVDTRVRIRFTDG